MFIINVSGPVSAGKSKMIASLKYILAENGASVSMASPEAERKMLAGEQENFFFLHEDLNWMDACTPIVLTEQQQNQHRVGDTLLQVGQRWLHVNSRTYLIVGFCFDADQYLNVLHVNELTGIMYTRTIDNFLGVHSSGVPRFTEVK